MVGDHTAFTSAHREEYFLSTNSDFQETTTFKVDCVKVNYGRAVQFWVSRRAIFSCTSKYLNCSNGGLIQSVRRRTVSFLLHRLTLLPDDPNVAWNEDVISNLIVNYVETLRFDAVRL